MNRVAAAVLVFSAATGAWAAVEEVQVGTKLRLHYQEARAGEVMVVTGTLQSADDASMTLVDSTHRSVTVPVEKIVRTEMSRGRHRHAGAGAIAGAAFGLVGGGVCLAAGCGGNGAALARSTAVWGGIGGLVGYLVQGESWSDVPHGKVRVDILPRCEKRAIAVAAAVSWR